MLQLLSPLSIRVDFSKFIFTLKQTIDFIGTTLNTVTPRVYLSRDRFCAMNYLIDKVMRNPQAPIRTVFSFWDT